MKSELARHQDAARSLPTPHVSTLCSPEAPPTSRGSGSQAAVHCTHFQGTVDLTLEKPFALAKFARKRRALLSVPLPLTCPAEGAKCWRAETCPRTRCEDEFYCSEDISDHHCPCPLCLMRERWGCRGPVTRPRGEGGCGEQNKSAPHISGACPSGVQL